MSDIQPSSGKRAPGTRILKIASLEAELAQKTAELERLKQLRAENTELRRLLDQAPPFTVHLGSTTPSEHLPLQHPSPVQHLETLAPGQKLSPKDVAVQTCVQSDHASPHLSATPVVQESPVIERRDAIDALDSHKGSHTASCYQPEDAPLSNSDSDGDIAPAAALNNDLPLSFSRLSTLASPERLEKSSASHAASPSRPGQPGPQLASPLDGRAEEREPFDSTSRHQQSLQEGNEQPLPTRLNEGTSVPPSSGLLDSALPASPARRKHQDIAVNKEDDTSIKKRMKISETRTRPTRAARTDTDAAFELARRHADPAELAAQHRVVLITGDLRDAIYLDIERQVGCCTTGKAAAQGVPKCMTCARRLEGDTCRFQGIRCFGIDRDGKIVTVAFKDDGTVSDLLYPDRWQVEPTQEDLMHVKMAIAKALLPILREEMNHIQCPTIIKRQRESDVRVTCDICNTSIFSASWMCRTCGSECCPPCFKLVTQYTSASVEQRGGRHPSFLACSMSTQHQAVKFSPVTRFEEQDLKQSIRELEEVLRLGKAPSIPEVPLNLKSQLARSTPQDAQYERVTRLACEMVTEEILSSFLKRGEPLIITGLLQRMQISWTPEYFIQHYGDRECLITNCANERTKATTVADFFQTFGNYSSRGRKVWKLKDWPPTADFKTSFPDLYHDFMNAVPVPAYTRRDGYMNIASHFPTNAVAPDLGPKMYNAQASTTGEGSKGSTRLHMDMADALNVMTYAASATRDSPPAGAAWDIFRPEDSATVRQYMRQSLHPTSSDPIHSQHYYLDDKLRSELFAETGVRSFHFRQLPGEAVIIPAGCAHQVSNLSDCIKVAVDFVSPENVVRCERLTEEFRQENLAAQDQWKEDVLQLKTMMWYAWVSCQQQQGKMDKGLSAV